MNEVNKFVNTAVIKDSTGSAVVTMGHLVALALGMLGLYLLIPERKRKNLLK